MHVDFAGLFFPPNFLETNAAPQSMYRIFILTMAPVTSGISSDFPFE